MVSIEVTGDTAEDVVGVVNGIFGSSDPKDARQVAREIAKFATVGLSGAKPTSSPTRGTSEAQMTK